MSGLRPVVKALVKASRRDRKSMWSFATNNFFLTTAMLGVAGLFFLFTMAIVLVFPLSSDPLRKIPEERLKLWPLTDRERIALHFVSPWVNPVTWALAAAAIWLAFHGAALVAASVVLIPSVGLLLSWLPQGSRGNVWRAIPAFPGGLGRLVQKDLREIFSTLDFWAALALSASCTFYRVFVHELPEDALMVFSILVVLALSSWSQSCFGLDGPEGLLRYELMPLRGWRILAAKGIAFLLVVTLLALPLSLTTAWASALVALGVGNAGSLHLNRQQRWRFSSGSGAINSVVQIVLLVAAGAAAFRVSPMVLVPSLLLFTASTFWFGRRLFRLTSLKGRRY